MKTAGIKKPQRSNVGAFRNVINFEVNHMANNSAATPIQQPAQGLMVDTPEAALIYNPAVDPRSLDDVMNCGLQRSLAVTRVLLGDIGENGQFVYSATTVANMLWLLEGQLEQLHSVIRNYRQGERP